MVLEGVETSAALASRERKGQDRKGKEREGKERMDSGSPCLFCLPASGALNMSAKIARADSAW